MRLDRKGYGPENRHKTYVSGETVLGSVSERHTGVKVEHEDCPKRGERWYSLSKLTRFTLLRDIPAFM